MDYIQAIQVGILYICSVMFLRKRKDFKNTEWPSCFNHSLIPVKLGIPFKLGTPLGIETDPEVLLKSSLSSEVGLIFRRLLFSRAIAL